MCQAPRGCFRAERFLPPPFLPSPLAPSSTSTYSLPPPMRVPFPAYPPTTSTFRTNPKVRQSFSLLYLRSAKRLGSEKAQGVGKVLLPVQSGGVARASL